MITHIGGGIRANGDEFPYFKVIINAIHEAGGSIARNWVQSANHKVTQKIENDEDVDWGGAVRENDYAMNIADLYIAETTAYRLYHGYELAQALQKGIPVLLVSRTSFRPYAISGVKNKLLTMKTYETTEELADIVKKFITAHEMAPEDRYVQTPVDYKLAGYLHGASRAQNKTKGEVLRELALLGLELQKITERNKKSR